MGTLFSKVYNRFLGKITDDMYVELTPLDTARDLNNLLIDAIPGFEFPRVNLYDNNENLEIIKTAELADEDFCLLEINSIETIELIQDKRILNLLTNEIRQAVEDGESYSVIDKSTFNTELTEEEIDILAILMMRSWLQRQITSIENIRMKYSGSDFKFTSQANHLSKLLALLTECNRQSHHNQRLYKRRKLGADGKYESNWGVFNYYGKQ